VRSLQNCASIVLVYWIGVKLMPEDLVAKRKGAN
jgi:hypothetical protein